MPSRTPLLRRRLALSPPNRRALWLAALALALPSIAPLRAQRIGVSLAANRVVNVEPGATVMLPLLVDLSAAGYRNMASLQTTTSWPASRLTFDSVRVVPGLDWTVTANTTQAAVGVVTVSAFSTAALTASGAVATLYFTAGAAPGGAPFTLQVDAAGNEAGQSIVPLVQPRAAAVCVAPTGVWGDVNSDAGVNIIDAQQIARYGVGLVIANSAALQARGDVNADGTVNVIDAQQVARFSVALSAVARINRALYVAPAVNSVVTSSAQTIPVGRTRLLSAQPRALDASDLAGCQTIAWSSADTTIAMVSPDGLVTASGPGTTVVTASSGGTSAATAITVMPVPAVYATLAAGYRHTCALKAGGDAYCWGNNTFGELGDGTNVSTTSPVRVSGGYRFVSITIGSVHTCGLTADGTAYCWGFNSGGRLGDGTALDRNVPTPVAGALRFVSIDPGGYHTCGLTAHGEAWCWGANSAGQLGTSNTTGSLVPVRVVAGARFSTLHSGFLHTCALSVTQVAFCWGSNGQGRVGNGASTGTVTAPTEVVGGRQFEAIVANQLSSCGRTSEGEAYCWGYGTTQLGGTPMLVAPAGTVAAFAPTSAAAEHICALNGQARTICWGANVYGQLGNGTREGAAAPVIATAYDARAAALAVGYRHTCVLEASGGAACWGRNEGGQLGDGSRARQFVPTLVAEVPVFQTLTAGGQSTCGLTAGGAAYCWGDNQFGQLGEGTATRRSTAAAIGGSQFVAVALGYRHGCGVTTAGSIACWGSNASGQLGDSTLTDRSTPTVLIGTASFAQIVAGQAHSCARSGTGRVSCWGSNAFGVLGIGSASATVTSLSLINTDQSFATLYANYRHSCALTADGAARCWGLNNLGQIGDGTTVNATSPVAVGGGLPFATLATGSGFTCGLDAAGGAHCWGANTSGQLGDGTTTTRFTPAPVAGGFTLTAVAASSSGACAVQSGGALSCWGSLEDATITTPTTVTSTAVFVQLVAGVSHYCGLTASGQAWCWGLNDFGQTGQPLSEGLKRVTGSHTFLVP